MAAGGEAPAHTVPARSDLAGPGAAFPSTPLPGMLHPSHLLPSRGTPGTLETGPELLFRVRDGAFCYPRSAMAQAKLTKKESDDLRARLLEEQQELQAQLTGIEEDSFAATQSEMTGDVGLDDEAADAGTATFEREKDLSIEQNVRDLLQKIERALKRMDEGTYGTCDRCGKPIEKARIKALPYVDLCIKDAQAQSRR